MLYLLILISSAELNTGFYIYILNTSILQIQYVLLIKFEERKAEAGRRKRERKNLISALNKSLHRSVSRVVMFGEGNVLESVMSDNSIGYRLLNSTVFTLAIVESARDHSCDTHGTDNIAPFDR